ncbi:hypothetical protein M9Y10_044236, partial [Tritrichomonas musculus]
YESLVGYLHMYFEYLGLSNTRFTNLDSGKVNLETFLSDYTSTVEDPDNHYEEIIGDFRTQKEADVRRIFKGVFLDIESVPLPEEQTIYMMLFNYKEARIYYEFLQHWYHYDKKLELDKPWYQIISELANVPSLLRGIRNHIYDKKYQTIIQKYSGLLSSIFSNENFISGLTTLVDDQDLKNSINDLENLIRRQETDENGNIIEIFPKEAISPEPIDYIECIVLYPNQYPATKQTIKDIVTEINELPDHGVQNGDLLLTIALIKIWNSGKRWLLPNEVYDTIMEFVKQLQAKKLTDCNALRDEKIFPEVHQMLQTFSNSWGQTKVFWTRQISAELAVKKIMIGNTELKQRAQDYTEILLNLQKVENIDRKAIEDFISVKVMEYQSKMQTENYAMIYHQIIFDIIGEIKKINKEMGNKLESGFTNEVNLFKESLNRWAYITEWVYQFEHNPANQTKIATEAWSEYPLSNEAIHKIRNYYGERNIIHEYRYWLGELAYLEAMFHLYNQNWNYTLENFVEKFELLIKRDEIENEALCEIELPKQIQNLQQIEAKTGQKQEYLHSEIGLQNLKTFTKTMLIRQKYYIFRQIYSDFIKKNVGIESRVMNEFLQRRLEERKKDEKQSAKEMQIQFDLEDAAENAGVETEQLVPEDQQLMNPQLNEDEILNEEDESNWVNNCMQFITNAKQFWQTYCENKNNLIPLFHLDANQLGIIHILNQQRNLINDKSNINERAFQQHIESLAPQFYEIIKKKCVIEYVRWKRNVPPSNIDEEISRYNVQANDENSINRIVDLFRSDFLKYKPKLQKLYDFLILKTNLPDFDDWSNSIWIETELEQNLNEWIQKKNEETLYLDDYQKYFSQVVALLRQGLDKYNIKIEKIRKIANQLFPNDINLYVTKDNDDWKQNMNAKINDPNFRGQIQAEIQQWDAKANERLSKIQAILQNQTTAGKVTQDNYQSAKTDFENKFIKNGNIIDSNKDAELQQLLVYSEAQKNEKVTIDKKQEIANLFASYGVPVSDKDLNKYTSDYFMSTNKQLIMTDINTRILREKENRDNADLTEFENKIVPQIQMINTISQVIPRVQAISIDAKRQQIMNTQKNRPAEINIVKGQIQNEINQAFSTCQSSQIQHYRTEIQKKIDHTRRSCNLGEEIEKILKTIIIENQTIAKHHENFLAWKSVWDANELTIDNKIKEIVEVIRNQNNSGFNAQTVSNEIFTTICYPNFDQNLVIQKLNQKLEEEKKNKKEKEYQTQINSLKSSFQEAYGREYSEEKWNELVNSKESTEKKIEKISRQIEQKNEQKGNQQLNCVNTINRCFSAAFPDWDPENVNLIIQNFLDLYPNLNSVEDVDNLLKSMEPKFKNCGRVFRLWNKHKFANTYLGLGILQSLNYDLNVLFENVELWEKRNKLFHYSPLSLLRAFLGDKSQQNQNVLQSLASFEQKRRNLERNDEFMRKFNSLSGSLSAEDKEDFLCEIVGHCDQPDDIDQYISLKTDWIQKGYDWKNWDQRKTFEETYNSNNGLEYSSRRIRSIYNQVTPQDNQQIDSLKTLLETNYPEKFSPVYWNEIEDQVFKNDGNQFLSYLEGERVYQDFLKLMPPNVFPPTFKQYYGNQDVHTALRNIQTLFKQKNDFAKTIRGDKELERAVREYNEIADVNDQYTLERILYLEKPTTSLELKNKFQNMLQEKVNGVDRNELLDETIRDIWRSYFPNDLKASSTWRSEFNGNYLAIVAIRKLSQLYHFYHEFHPDEEVNLSKIVKYFGNSIDETQKKLEEYYTQNIEIFNNQWKKNKTLKGYLEEFKDDFGGSVDLARKRAYGKFHGNLEHCLKFFKNYKLQRDLETQKTGQVRTDINTFLGQVLSNEDPNTLLDGIESEHNSRTQSQTNWNRNADFRNHGNIKSRLDNDHQIDITYDITWDSNKMYNNYLIPIAEKYYEQITNKKYHPPANLDLSNPATKYQTIVQEAETIREKNENWDITEVQSTLDTYKNQDKINVKITYDELKKKYENPQDALKFLEIEKLKKDILVKLWKPDDEELPRDNKCFKKYFEYQENQLTERLHELRNIVGMFKEDRRESWGSDNFSKILQNYRIYFSEDTLRSSADKCQIYYENDYHKGKTELEYLYNLAHFHKTFQEPYFEKQPSNPSVNEMKETNDAIDIIMNNYKDYKLDSNLTGKIEDYNTYSGKDHQTKLSLVKKFKQDKQKAKIFLDHGTWLGKILSFGDDQLAKSQTVSVEGIAKLKEIYSTKTKDDEAFKSQEFQMKLDEYNALIGDTKTITDMKNDYKTYTNALYAMNSTQIKYELINKYQLKENDVNALMADTWSQSYQNLKNKKNDLDTIISNCKSDSEIVSFHDDLKRNYDTTTPILDQLIKDEKYDIPKLYYHILSKLWKRKSGEDVQWKDDNSFQSQNEKLANLLHAFDRRKKAFNENSELLQLVNDPTVPVTQEQLWKRYMYSTKHENDDAKDAIQFMKNEKRKKIYLKKWNELGKKIDEKTWEKFTKEDEREEFFEQMEKEYRQEEKKWNQIGKFIPYYNSYHDDKNQLLDWEQAYQKWEGNYEKAKDEIELSNLAHSYELEFGKKWESQKTKKEQIKYLTKIEDDWLNYYKYHPTFMSVFNDYNNTLTSQAKKLEDVIDKYGSDVNKITIEMSYELLTTRMKAIDPTFKAEEYYKNEDGVQRLENEYKTLQANNNSVLGDSEITGLFDTYKVNYPDDTRKLWNISKDMSHNKTEVKNFFLIKNLIHEIQNDYTKVFNYNDRSNWGSTSTYQVNYLEKERDRLKKELDQLKSIGNINELVDIYNDMNGFKDASTQKDLKKIFVENDCQYYKTYYYLLAHKYNSINPEKKKALTYSGSGDRACRALEKEIREVEEVESQLKLNKKWKDLTLEEQDMIMKNNKDPVYAIVYLESKDDIKNYNEQHEIPFDFDQTIKKWKKEGRDIHLIPHYLKIVNKITEDDSYYQAINKFKKDYPDELTPDLISKLGNAYEIYKFVVLTPLQKRYAIAFGKSIELSQMMNYAKTLKDKYEVKWGVVDQDLPFDIEIAKIANEARIIQKEYQNTGGIKNKKQVKFEETLAKEKNEEGGNTKEKVIDYIKQIKSDMEQSKLESEQTINENIDRINKDKKDGQKIQKEKFKELSVYSKDLEVINAIIEYLPIYEKHFQKEMTIDDLKKYHSDPKNPDWINVLQIIAFSPLIDDYNSIQKKQKNLISVNVESIRNKYIIEEQKVENTEDITYRHVQVAEKSFREEVDKLKKTYFDKLLTEYHKHIDDSSETLDQLLQLYTSLDDLERYLKLNRYIAKTNSIYKQLKEHYKKEHTPLKYSDYENKPINNLEPSIIILQNLQKEAQKEWDDEKKKDDKAKEHKQKVESKLNDLNSIRRKVGLAEIGFERYKNQETDTALSDIQNMYNEARQKETEKNNQNTTNTIGGALRNTGYVNPLNKPATTPTTPTTQTPPATTEEIPKIKDESEKKDESVWSRNYEGGITSLIQQSAKGISIRSLLMEQQKKNKLNGRPNIMSQFNENAPPKPVVPYQTNSNINNLFSSKTTMTEEKETPIEKKPLVSPISEKPMTMTKIEPGKKINLLPTKVDSPEVITTKSNMIQVLPRRGRKNLPLRFKRKEEMQKQVKIDEDEDVDEEPMNTKAKPNKQFKKQKSERTKALKKNPPKKNTKKKVEEDVTDTILDKQDISKKKPLQRKTKPEPPPKWDDLKTEETPEKEEPPKIETVKPKTEIPSVIQNNPSLMKYFK